MALKGNLRDFSVTQLLNLINLAHKTGALTIESDGTTARMYFKEGRLLHASIAGQDDQLTAILQKAGKLTPEQAQIIRTRSQVHTDKELGLLLITAGYLSQDDILSSVKQHVLDVVYYLFPLTNGRFHFEPDQLPPADRITVSLDLESIIMEGSRRIKEWERLQEELPDLDVVLKFADRPRTSLRHINLNVDEWRVISFINGRNTIRQIAQHNGMSEFQIRKIVYGLLSAGLVELVEPAEQRRRAAEAVPAGKPAAPVQPPAVKRNIIMRIIDRIRGI
ncbi:MAG: DUF4388 domain-containing protein [Anaerolineae bacterium]|nr:DUF4388 domain-containing protein [Anaerolineae bacterium]